jgi:hypothetical protein
MDLRDRQTQQNVGTESNSVLVWISSRLHGLFSQGKEKVFWFMPTVKNKFCYYIKRFTSLS